MKPTFFAKPAEFRRWLEENHDRETELLVGFYKRDSGKPSITWPESVDAALCFGWIDGVRRSIDEESYTIRFTPRKSSSVWSGVNIKRVAELTELGLMHLAGQKAFEKRKAHKSQIYSYEQRNEAKLDPPYEKKFKANKKAWAFFQSQAPWYQRTSIYWVMTAKQQQTRDRRFAQLLADSAAARRIRQLARATKTPRH